MYKSIVVGIDGSGTARAAMLKAADLAKLTGARVHIVTASARGYLADLVAIEPMAAGVIDALRTAEADVASASERLLERAAEEVRDFGVDVETHLVDDSPADGIVGVAESVGADLIIVGNKGMRGKKRYVLGSVPNSVAHSAPCDVTIVSTS
ncbi:MAG: universal stress protein [Actinobacteria bacterium]|nr:MAG: universal stress protein [Actinomycetota bacterium]